MSAITLSKLFRKNRGVKTFLQELCTTLGNDVAIYDRTGKQLIGDGTLTDPKSLRSLYFQEQEIGKISEEAGTNIIQDAIQLFLKKEKEKKQLSNEVLGLYREINLIYKFTQKLAEKITPTEIAALTLEESRSFLKAQSGFIYLFAEEEKIVSEFDLSASDKQDIDVTESPLFRAINAAQGGILNDYDGKGNSLIFAPLAVTDHHIGAVVLSSESIFTAADLKLLSTLAQQASVAIETALLYEKNIQEARAREAAIRALHQITSKFVPNEFIKALGHDKITQVALGDSVERKVTVLFSDIRDYTSLSEMMTPEETFQFVNSFNGRMGPIILKNNGFVNQYLGDGIMAIFPFSAQDALATAIEMQAELKQYNKGRLKKGREKIRIGIGLHTGHLIMGITGDDQRLDATTISDTVNTASRIETLTKKYSVNILISEDTLHDIGLPQIEQQVINIRYLGKAKVKGKQQPIKVFECFNNDAQKVRKLKQDTIHLFDQAIEQWQDKHYHQAIQQLNEVLAYNPDDLPANTLVEEIHHLSSQNASNIYK